MFFESYSVLAATLRYVHTYNLLYLNSPHPHEVCVKTSRS